MQLIGDTTTTRGKEHYTNKQAEPDILALCWR